MQIPVDEAKIPVAIYGSYGPDLIKAEEIDGSEIKDIRFECPVKGKYEACNLSPSASVRESTRFKLTIKQKDTVHAPECSGIYSQENLLFNLLKVSYKDHNGCTITPIPVD